MDITGFGDEKDLEEQGAVLPIYMKNGDPYESDDGKQCTITVVGSDSKRVTAQHRRAQQKRLNRGAKKLTQPEIERATLDADVAAVLSWKGWQSDGEEAECTPDNLRLMFINAPWIQRQVQEGIAAHSDFIGSPSQT